MLQSSLAGIGATRVPPAVRDETILPTTVVHPLGRATCFNIVAVERHPRRPANRGGFIVFDSSPSHSRVGYPFLPLVRMLSSQQQSQFYTFLRKSQQCA